VRLIGPKATALGLGQLTADEAGAQDVELGLAHRPFQAEQQPVVEVHRVVEAVLVENEGVGQGADLEQPVPVGRAASQTGDLQAEHDPDLAHSDRGDQLLEPLAVTVGTRLAQVAVDDHDSVQRPAQGDRPLAQRVLALGALGVLEDLA